MRTIYILFVFLFALPIVGKTQGIHFSQYFNSMMLMDPANTGLLLNSDWRVGAQFRSQWALVPVPYNTLSAFGDITLNKGEYNNGWGGIGIAFWNDKAGSAALTLNKIQISGAYHIKVGNYGLMSFGMAVANCSRRVDFSKLTFDSQWDDAQYNPTLPNQEPVTLGKSQYWDLQLGGNFVHSTERSLFKASVSAQHINKPNESFLGQTNRIGIRPIFNLEAQYKANDNLILAPSMYYTTQKRASEFIMGSMAYFNLSGKRYGADEGKSEMLAGIYYRFNDALIFATGFRFKNKTITLNYDLTVSSLAVANNSFGALELSLIVEGDKTSNRTGYRAMGCPRF